MPRTSRVAVVGAGAAGISAAFWLTRAGAEVTVFEAGDQVGGRARTVRRGDFRFDVGAGVLPSAYADVLRLVDALGIRDEIELRTAVIGALRDGVAGSTRRSASTWRTWSTRPRSWCRSGWRRHRTNRRRWCPATTTPRPA